MIKVERVMTLDHPLREVAGFLADFSNAELWDPGTITCNRVDTGGLSVGSEWHNLSEFWGRRTELLYRLTRFDADHLTFVGRNKTATSTDDMRFEEHDGRTRLTYRARVEFNGLARLATPLLKREFDRLGDEVSERLPQAVDRALRVPPSGGGHPQ
ncbi:SRPBCC family protein [Streptomyces sp. MBT65]|nr:SRPBCC family protein [Streptomyces sp. MBT65]